MTDAKPALLALLVALSLPTTALVAADTADGTADPARAVQSSVFQDAEQATPVEVDETTNRLPLPGPVENEYTAQGSNLGAMLAATDEELRVDHEQYALVDEEFDEATPEEQAEMIEAAHDRIKDRIEALETRERTAVRDHANGDRSGAAVVQILLENYYEATVLDATLDDLEDRSNDVPGYSLSSSETRSDSGAIDIHRTQIRSELAAVSESATSGSDAELDVLLLSSQDGFRLATIDGSTYMTETVRFDNRRPAAPDQFDDDDADTDYPALSYSRELYPYAATPDQPGYAALGDLSRVLFDHDDGTVELYLDAGAGEVFREHQTLSVGSLPVVESESWTQDGLDLSIEATPANGPIEVTVTDASTGDPVSANVSVDGYHLGRTDEDGTLWYVPPIGGYDLTAETETSSHTATIDIRT